MRSTRRSGGDNGYRTAEDFSNEGRGYERPSSYSDRYRFERDDTDYRGQGNEQNGRWNNSRENNYYGNNNRNENPGRNREWTNHQSGWNDNGANWRNPGMQDNNRYRNDGSYGSSGNRDFGGYGRSSNGAAPRSMSDNDDYRPGNRRYPQEGNYDGRQNTNRGNGSYYNSQNDFLENEEDDYGDSMTNRNGYNENANNDYRRGSTGNNYGSRSSYGNADREGSNYTNQYGNLWNRDDSNRQDINSSRRSRQGFGSMSKERRQEIASQGGKASHENH